MHSSKRYIRSSSQRILLLASFTSPSLVFQPLQAQPVSKEIKLTPQLEAVFREATKPVFESGVDLRMEVANLPKIPNRNLQISFFMNPESLTPDNSDSSYLGSLIAGNETFLHAVHGAVRRLAVSGRPSIRSFSHYSDPCRSQ